MSDEKPAAPAEGATDGAPATPPGSKLELIVPLINTVVILAAIGMMVFTQVLYKRPPITESGERKRLAALHASPTPPPVPGLMEFEPVTVNIAPNPSNAPPTDQTPVHAQGKLHYVYMGFALELRDAHQKNSMEEIKPLILDAVLSMLGHKNFNELVTVQGRYVLKTQILEKTNELAMKEIAAKENVVTNVYLNQFMVQ